MILSTLSQKTLCFFDTVHNLAVGECVSKLMYRVLLELILWFCCPSEVHEILLERGEKYSADGLVVKYLETRTRECILADLAKGENKHEW